MRIVYGVSYFNQLRKWYVVSILHRLVRRLRSQQFSFIDVGSGEGQYLFPLAAKYPHATLTGIDKSPGNVRFGNAYIRKRPFRNVTMLEGVAEAPPPVAPADIVMFVGVLHFVEDDAQTMAALAGLIKPGGQLLLEVPVNDKILLPLYKAVLKRYGNYDSINGRKKKYLPEDVLKLVTDCGLQIESATYAYGTFGKLGHELYNTSLVILLGGNLLERILFSIIINLLYPVTLVLYILDFCFRHKDGNCLIVVAGKPR